MIKPWKIVATYPNQFRATIATYSSRACAEADAQKLQRLLSAQQIQIRVVWIHPNPNPPV